MHGRFWEVSAALFSAALALAGQAYASTISNYSISTSAPGGTPCSMSGSGPGSASCSSTNGFSFNGTADVTLTDDSIILHVDSSQAGGASGFASITHDEFYSVPVNGPIVAVENFSCTNQNAVRAIGHFSLGSTSVSPPVENIWMGASQGSGPCGLQFVIAPVPNTFLVSLVATNNIVHVHTYIDASGGVADDVGRIFIQLTLVGFQDANGNPITATLVPEPGTWLTLGLGLLIVVGVKRLNT